MNWIKFIELIQHLPGLWPSSFLTPSTPCDALWPFNRLSIKPFSSIQSNCRLNYIQSVVTLTHLCKFVFDNPQIEWKKKLNSIRRWKIWKWSYRISIIVVKMRIKVLGWDKGNSPSVCVVQVKSIVNEMRGGSATYLMNISIPVGCIARLMPFHDAIIVYFWRAVRGNRGSGAVGGGGSLGLVALSPSDFVLDANLPNSQPIFAIERCLLFYISSIDK